jgi:hypothetical protein
MEAFIEYSKKYLSVLDAHHQLRLSLLLNRNHHIDLSAHTLQSLIDSTLPLNPSMEQAYLYLAKIYGEQLNRNDLARHVYERFIQKFPGSEHSEFSRKRLLSIQSINEPTVPAK